MAEALRERGSLRPLWAPKVLDCWDATRDARLYAGPHPVVAHPPCKHWGRLRHLAKNGPHAFGQESPACLLCGGEPGRDVGRTCPDNSDRDCAPRAVEQVRAFGGVLEHPAGSKLWEACGLPTPQQHALVRTADTSDWEGPLFPRRDEHGGWCVELDQVEWGHACRKPTWLYLVGVPREALESPPFPGREPTHGIFYGRWERSGHKGPKLLGASKEIRRRTPPLFAEYLVRLARSVQK